MLGRKRVEQRYDLYAYPFGPEKVVVLKMIL